MNATLVDEVFVFVSLKDAVLDATIVARMVFQELEGTTYIIGRDAATAAGLDYEFPCRMITLDVHSSLDAIGFIARIATELANAGMGVNPVSGFFHDHLFVPDGKHEEAMDVLRQIAKNASTS